MSVITGTDNFNFMRSRYDLLSVIRVLGERIMCIPITRNYKNMLYR